MSSTREWVLSGALEREEKEVGAVRENSEAVGERRRRRAWKDRLLRKIAFMALSVFQRGFSYVANSSKIHHNTTLMVNGTKSKEVASTLKLIKFKNHLAIYQF